MRTALRVHRVRTPWFDYDYFAAAQSRGCVTNHYAHRRALQFETTPDAFRDLVDYDETR